MNIYEELGVRTLINAAGTVTMNGGSIMAPEVLQAMQEASQHFCLLNELHEAVGKKIAQMLDVEAAYVTASASSGLVLTTAACMAGTDPDKIKQLPDATGMRSEILIQTGHRIPYDQALRLPGAKLIAIQDDGAPPVDAMQAAITAKTAAIFYLANAMNDAASIPMAQVIDMAHAAAVPVIVDAASECPPMSTLARFTKLGADLVIFSGGKSLMGPQSTGLIVGRKDLVTACMANGNPFAAVGRPMKVSREEIVAFLKALERYLSRDHEADQQQWEAQIRHIGEAISDIPQLAVTRYAKGETYHVPMLRVTFDEATGIAQDIAIEALLQSDPPIIVRRYETADSILINPHNLQPGQEEIVAERCKTIFSQLVASATGRK